MKPVVSILIPVYNRGHLINETLDSALGQRFEGDFEVIAVDNASTDNTWEVLAARGRRDRRLKVHRNPTNIGPVRNWLACVNRAEGEFSKILWSDDLLHPDCLATLVPMLRNPLVGFAYSAAQVFTDRPRSNGSVVYADLSEGQHESQIYIEKVLLDALDVPVSPGCALFRTADLRRNLREHIPNVIGSDFSMHAIGNDLLLFLLTAGSYPLFASTRRPLALFRDHKGSITSSSSAARLVLHYDLAKAHFVEECGVPPALRPRFNAHLVVDRLFHRGSRIGLKSLRHFYLRGDSGPVSSWYLACLIAAKGLRKAHRALKRQE